jgi:flagellar hook-length control protein FliK
MDGWGLAVGEVRFHSLFAPAAGHLKGGAHVVNPIQSALGMVKSLLPVSTGGPLLVSPKLPDLPSFLDNLTSMLQGLLGSSPDASQAPPAPPASTAPTGPSLNDSPTAAAQAGMVMPTLPKLPVKSDDQVVREREQAQRDAQRRSENLASADTAAAQLEQIRKILEGLKNPAAAGSGGSAPGAVASGGPAAPTIQDLVQALEELKRRLAGPAEGAQAQAQAPTVPLPTAAPAAPAVPAQGQPVDSAMVAAAVPDGKVAVPAGGIASAPVLEAQASPAGPAPAFLPMREILAKGDLLPAFQEQAKGLADGTDPMTGPASLLSPSPVVVQAVVVQAVVEQDPSVRASQSPDRRAPVVGGIADRPLVATGPSNRAPDADPPSAADQAELVDRIIEAARLTQSRGSSRIKIALNPPELGELKVDLSVRQHVLYGTLQTDSDSAKQTILSHLQSLKDSLQQQGIQVGEFQVQVDPSFQQSAQQNPNDGRPHSGAAAPPGAASDALAGSVEERLRSSRLQLFDVVA